MGGEHCASGRRKPRRSKHFRSTWEGTGYDAYMDVAELPSKPDPLTGQPRPPRAPVPIGLFSKEKEEKPLKEHDADREHDRRWCPSPPGGEGPLLEWYRASRWNALRSTAVLTLILFVGLCGEQLGFAWMAYWFPWGFILGGGLFMYFRQRWKCFAAGAEWLKVRDNWVRLYELRRIECGGRSGGASGCGSRTPPGAASRSRSSTCVRTATSGISCSAGWRILPSPRQRRRTPRRIARWAFPGGTTRCSRERSEAPDRRVRVTGSGRAVCSSWPRSRAPWRRELHRWPLPAGRWVG